MTTSTIKNGNKVATIKEGTDGYGDKVIRVSVTQTYFDGIDLVERFIGSKTFEKEASAKRWANKEVA
jgi:hypothetical protein